MEYECFLEPCSDVDPAGEDLDSSGDILSLDMLAKWGSADAETDWRQLLTASEFALHRSRDLRAASYLTAALLHTEGILGFLDGIRMLRSLLEIFWEDLHPRADEDGEFMERSGALFNLTNFHKVLRPLRGATLVEFAPVGRFSLHDIEIAEGAAEAPADYPGNPPNVAMIDAAFHGADGDRLRELAARLADSVKDMELIESIFREHAGLEQAPDMSRLRDILRRILTALKAHVPETPAEATIGDAASAQLPPPGNARGMLPSEIRTRQEAVAAIDSIAIFFRTHEPSSPVPLLMARAKRLIDLDFLSIIEDIAPDAVAQVKKLHGNATDN